MLLGSNNSLTYLKPRHMWFNWLRKNLGRCQRIPYDEQYTYYGVRFFDFKLSVDDKNHIIVKNKDFTYNMFSFYEILDYLDKRGDAKILITLDVSSNEICKFDYDRVENKFIEICYIVESIYEDLSLLGGYRRCDKKLLYEFKYEKEHGMPQIIVPSDWSRWYSFISKWCPRFIGKLNKKYIEQFKNSPSYLLLDYVDIR